jgi:trimethylamine-N-oxide reductase (cytochrome c)
MWNHIGTQAESKPLSRCSVRSLEFVVNQAIWMEVKQIAELILPACTNFERWDIRILSSGVI